jgi:hypothetical protein
MEITILDAVEILLATVAALPWGEILDVCAELDPQRIGG